MKFHDQFQNLTLGSQNNCDSQRTSHNSLVIQIMENQSFWSEQCIPVHPPPAVSVYSDSSLWISLLFQLEFDGSSFHTLHSRYRLFLQCRIYFPILQIVWSHHSYRFLDWCDSTDCVVLYDPCECHLQGKGQVQGQQIPASLRSDRRTSTFPFVLISLHLDLRILRIAGSVPVLLHLRMQELFGHDGMSNYNDLSTSL